VYLHTYGKAIGNFLRHEGGFRGRAKQDVAPLLGLFSVHHVAIWDALTKFFN